MASVLTEVRRIADRYADLVALQRQLVPPFVHEAVPLLKIASLGLPVPHEAAGVAVQLRIARGLADTVPIETKVRAVWMALLDTSVPLAAMDEVGAVFTERYAVRPIKTLVRNLSPASSAALQKQFAVDAVRFELGFLAEEYLGQIFAAPDASTPGAPVLGTTEHRAGTTGPKAAKRAFG